MTNPFIDYEFQTSDASSLSRTLPDRLSDFHNVKDFGATGDGVTDDHDAIMACFNWTGSGNRGNIYFPPGTYYVSEQLALTPSNLHMFITGVRGASTIVGDFADYVISRLGDNISFIGDLIIRNDNAAGGGIRFAGAGHSIRNCNITANICINATGDDTADGGATSLECAIVNCQLSPGAHTSGSVGIVDPCNGPINNCRIIGFERGITTWGQQGGQAVQGCYFEGNQHGFHGGTRPNGTTEFCPGSGITGCWFKNNGTALYLPQNGGTMHVSAVRVDADESVTVYGSPPQYGIRMAEGAIVADFNGVVVTGQYEQAAIVVYNNDSVPHSTYTAVSAFNTSSAGGAKVWDMALASVTSKYIACNCDPRVFTMAALPVFLVQVNSGTWDSGTGMTTMSMFGNFGPYDGANIQVTFTGLSPAGFNGTYICTHTSGNDLIYSQSNPGGTTTTGNPFAVVNINDSVVEGETFNVSDSSTSTWASNPLAGGSTHAKVRWNGTNWSVVGI